MTRVPKATVPARIESGLAKLDEGAGVRRAEPRPVELDPASVGHLTRMDAVQVRAMAQCQQRRRRCERDRVEAALDRLATGDYGYCAVCGEEIGLKRLEFDPAAVTCIRCAGRSD